MTAEQRAALDRARTRIARLQPDVLAAILVAFRQITHALTEAGLVRVIASGAIDRVVTVLLADLVLDRATMPLRVALRDVVEKAFRWNVSYLPKGGKVNGTVAVMFDTLNPRVLEALRSLETSAITTLKDDVREAVRQTIARGLEQRQAPTTIARTVRAVIGLSPRGEHAVANYRTMLEAGDREALSRLLRDRRFDQTLEKALGADGKGLSEKQIDAMTDAYRRRAIAANAETISRTATQTAYKIANDESWRSAVERGIIHGGSLRKQWIGVDDERERDSHRVMNDEIVAFDSPYSNGQIIPGFGEYNCRCISRVFVA